MDSDSQERELKHYYGIDRLSDLPDSIMCKILSYLPTKNAVAASILSTRWRSFSPFLAPPIILDLDDSLLLVPCKNKSKKPSTSFLDFVDKLLNETLFDVPCVEVLMLSCHKYYDEAKITDWVCTALQLNVRELVLRVRLNTSNRLFHVLNGCTTLTSLELGKSFLVRVPDEFTLPNLKVLVLFKLKFHAHGRQDMLCNLIAGCPALEDLCFSNCNLQQWGRVEIESHVLKKLTIKDSWLDESSCELQLDVPNLEVLLYDDYVAGNYYLSNFKSLLLAHIDVGLSEQVIDELEGDSETEEHGFWYANGVGMVVTACSSTVLLSLATQSISALQRSREQLPIFQNLTTLALGCLLRSEGWALLARLLCHAPNLEKLTMEEGFGRHEGGYSSFMSVVPKPLVCLEFHVKEIEFKVFRQEEDEIKLVEYFLNNGKVIQKLEIHCLPFKDMSTLSRLPMLPRHSKIDFKPR